MNIIPQPNPQEVNTTTTQHAVSFSAVHLDGLMQDATDILLDYLHDEEAPVELQRLASDLVTMMLYQTYSEGEYLVSPEVFEQEKLMLHARLTRNVKMCQRPPKDAIDINPEMIIRPN